jgi:hypothetical protein
MKTMFRISRPLIGAAILLAGLAVSAAAQDNARLNLDALKRFETGASQTIDVNVDGRMLQLAIRVLSAGEAKNPDLAKIRDAVSGLKGVYVRSFQFDTDNAYTAADVEQIRSQLRPGTWERMVGVRSQKNGQNVEVFTMFEGDRIGGLTVLATDVRHLTVVNIVGMIDLEKLMALQGTLGIPNVNITTEPKTQE